MIILRIIFRFLQSLLCIFLILIINFPHWVLDYTTDLSVTRDAQSTGNSY